MKLSQTAAYAVHAVLQLACRDGIRPVSSGELARRGNMPERFLLQILRDLAKQGILHSSRGGGGGFRLERDPAEISLLELIEAIDGPLLAGLPQMSLPGQSGLLIRDTLQRISETTRQQLAAVKLAHLVATPTVALGSPATVAGRT